MPSLRVAVPFTFSWVPFIYPCARHGLRPRVGCKRPGIAAEIFDHIATVGRLLLFQTFLQMGRVNYTTVVYEKGTFGGVSGTRLPNGTWMGVLSEVRPLDGDPSSHRSCTRATSTCYSASGSGRRRATRTSSSRRPSRSRPTRSS